MRCSPDGRSPPARINPYFIDHAMSTIRQSSPGILPEELLEHRKLTPGGVLCKGVKLGQVEFDRSAGCVYKDRINKQH